MLVASVESRQKSNVHHIFSDQVAARQENELDLLLDQLSPGASWGDRRTAARRIGMLRNPQALPALVSALPVDNFWMVRCEIIQALESIGDPAAVPALQSVACHDSFKVVREYAARAVDRLS